ncbi:MAG: OmpH family outer membrane protein [Bernardetiaceae bacterium]
MKRIIPVLIPLLLLMGGLTQAQTLKIGYTSPQMILTKMEAYKLKQSELEEFAKVLQKQFETKQQAYQRRAEEVRGNFQNLAPVEQEKVMKEFQEKEQELVKLQQDSQQKLQKKEEELMEPLYKQIKEAINAVSEEQGYTYIINAFDGTGSANLLYAKESLDVTDAVLQKLGVSAGE